MPRLPHASPQTLQLFETLLDDPQRWRYGYDLSKETALASGTMYPILMRLAAQHLLDTAWEPSDEPGRPPRHIYRLTADGIALARQRVAARETSGAPIVRARPAGGLA
jgi:PadR family transcriptional regulator PadR